VVTAIYQSGNLSYRMERLPVTLSPPVSICVYKCFRQCLFIRGLYFREFNLEFSGVQYVMLFKTTNRYYS